MKRLQSVIAISVMCSTACYAQQCPDPKLRQAEVGRDTIEGSVSLHQKPLKFAQFRLLSNGKTARVGTTDSNGSFRIPDLRPGIYHLSVRGWGSTLISVRSDLTKTPRYELLLEDSGCIITLMVVN